NGLSQSVEFFFGLRNNTDALPKRCQQRAQTGSLRGRRYNLLHSFLHSFASLAGHGKRRNVFHGPNLASASSCSRWTWRSLLKWLEERTQRASNPPGAVVVADSGGSVRERRISRVILSPQEILRSVSGFHNSVSASLSSPAPEKAAHGNARTEHDYKEE